ncbi:MAG: hypothetical protein NXH74_04710 [Rhodobacteraceae bacterium]|jgi:hypothetical protein|nr:hypothetical protein [Paracoccaceae bacterium]
MAQHLAESVKERSVRSLKEKKNAIITGQGTHTALPSSGTLFFGALFMLLVNMA